jgi:hypothetical protein
MYSEVNNNSAYLLPSMFIAAGFLGDFTLARFGNMSFKAV